jgi:hypothetical protein
MEITAYNLHWRLLSLRVLVLRKNSSLLGAREEPSLLSNQAKRGSGLFAHTAKTQIPRCLRSSE